jgi:hypothetical protein
MAAPTKSGAESGAIAKLRQRSRVPISRCPPLGIRVARRDPLLRSAPEAYHELYPGLHGAGDSANAASWKVLQFCNWQKGGGTCGVGDAWCADTDQRDAGRGWTL